MRRLTYHIGRLTEEAQWALDFADAMSRSVAERLDLGVFFVRLPVIDEAPYRVFDTIAGYRTWAQEQLPEWLGYGVDD